MATAFDAAAAAYDETFTHSLIGKYQRGQVYRYLTDLLQDGNIRILEINCGTGEDAVWLASQGFHVTAADISENMIAVAKKKSDKIAFVTADTVAIATDFSGQRFDLVFSNFGGLNCLNPTQLEGFFKNVSGLLTEKGKLALVIMPKSTLWERLYFLLKGNLSSASRRKNGQAAANVDGRKVATFYYNPSTVKAMAKHGWIATKVKPVGFFVPPSYLEPALAKRTRLAAMLDRLDHTFDWPLLSKYADHYFITFEKR